MSTDTTSTIATELVESSASPTMGVLGLACETYRASNFSAYLQCLSDLLPPEDEDDEDPLNISSSNPDLIGLHVTNMGSSRPVFIFLYSLVFVVSFVGNFGVCYIVVRKSRMRSVTNFFLANQALSDVLMAVLNIPFVVTKQLTNLWAVGRVMCHLVDYMGVMSVYVSTFILTIIAIDRHRVLVHPLRPRITMSTAIVIAISIWILAFLLAIPFAVFVKLVTYKVGDTTGYTCIEKYPLEHWSTIENATAWSTLIFQYILPFTIIAASYISIGRKLWSTRAVGDTMAAQQAATARRKIRTTRLLVLAVLVFGICWLPLHVYLIVTRYMAHHKDAFTYLCCHWFAMCSVCINPIAFCFLNESLRSDLRVTLSKFASRIRGTKNDGVNNQTLSQAGNPHSVTHQSGLTSEAPGSPRMVHKRIGPSDDRNGNLIMVAAIAGNDDLLQGASHV